MPWCDDCAKFWNPPSLGEGGTCPTCGRTLTTPAAAPPTDDAVPRAPWHFKLLLVALRDVAEAQGGLRKLARSTRLHRGNLHKMLSKKGNPEVTTLIRLLNTFGLRLSVTTKTSRSSLKKAA